MQQQLKFISERHDLKEEIKEFPQKPKVKEQKRVHTIPKKE
jgi:hypothetical protein